MVKINPDDIRVFSQRDERWSDEILGNSGTIGRLGCVITCLASVSDLNPGEVNQCLKDVGGYVAPPGNPEQKNLVIWSKIDEAIPWLEWKGVRVRESDGGYDNERVLQAIEKYGFCLVEVDATRIGAPKHWVVYLGNQEMFDPWYGNIKGTGYYRALGFSILERKEKPAEGTYKGYPIDDMPRKSIEALIDLQERVYDRELVDKEKLEVAKNEIDDLNKKLGEKRGELKAKIKEVEGLEKDLGDATGKTKQLKKNLKRAKDNHKNELDNQHDFAEDANKEEKERKKIESEFNKYLERQEEVLKIKEGVGDREERKEKVLERLEGEISRESEKRSKLIEENDKLKDRINNLERKYMGEYPKWKKALWEAWRIFLLSFLGVIAAQLQAGIDIKNIKAWLISLGSAALIAGIKAVTKWAREKLGKGEYEKFIYKIPA